MKKFQHEQGFTLIEIMITLLISSILLGAVIMIMISSQRSYSTQSDRARMQENARFAMDFLSRDIRMSGYTGCTNERLSLPGAEPLAGIDNNDNTPDQLAVSFMDTTAGAFLVEHRDNDNNPGNTPPPSPFQQGSTGPFTDISNNGQGGGFIEVGDTVIVSDCGGSDTYTVAGVSGNDITLTSGLIRLYNNAGESFGAQMRRLVRVHYRVLPAGCNVAGNIATDGGSLCISFWDNATGAYSTTWEELIEGVENMQLRYGIDDPADDNVPNYFTTAGRPGFNAPSANLPGGNTSANKIIVVRVTLLMQTVNQRFNMPPDRDKNSDGVADSLGYRLDPEVTIPLPADYRRRNVFSNTILIRNSIL